MDTDAHLLDLVDAPYDDPSADGLGADETERPANALGVKEVGAVLIRSCDVLVVDDVTEVDAYCGSARAEAYRIVACYVVVVVADVVPFQGEAKNHHKLSDKVFPKLLYLHVWWLT